MSHSRRWMMKLLTLLGLATMIGISPLAAQGQQGCPPEVDAAQKMVQAQLAAQKQPNRVMAGARTGDQQIQAPRGDQQIQAPRGDQQIQAPRGDQQIQAPRGDQQTQAPRGGQQDIQAPRATGSQEIQAPRTAPTADQASLKKAQALVKEARAACKRGDNAAALEKAKAATALLK